MNDKDKKDFARIITAMAENFNSEISREGMRIRFEALADCTIEQVSRACTSLVKNRTYPGMPTTGEIRAAIPGKKSTLADLAQIRVNEIIGQIRKTGSYGCPTWDDPVVKLLLSSRWNWRNLCAMTETELKWWAKEFMEAYRSMAGSEGLQQVECQAALKKITAGIGWEVK